MAKYGDPRKMNSKFPGKCLRCGAKIERGDIIYYWPLTKTARCEKCGEEDYLKCMAAIADEEQGFGG